MASTSESELTPRCPQGYSLAAFGSAGQHETAEQSLAACTAQDHRRRRLTNMRVVLVDLEPLDGSLQRSFCLNSTTPLMEVGRASKTESKGLVAKKDNAWFDSPIMSRVHAFIEITPEKVSVEIHTLLEAYHDSHT